MSIKLMSEVFQNRSVPAKLRMVLLAICDSAGDNHICWPSLSHIAWKTELSERTVSRAVNELEEMGVLVIKRRHRKSSIYYVDLSVLPIKKPLEQDVSDEASEFLSDVIGRQNVVQENDLWVDKHDTVFDKHDKNDDKHDTKPAPNVLLNRHVTINESSQNESAPVPVTPAIESPKRAPNDVWALVAAYCDATGIAEVTNKGKAAGQAKNLLSAGFTPDEIRAAVQWLSGESWIAGAIDLGTILTHADKFRAQRVGRSAPAMTDQPPSPVGYDPLNPSAFLDYQRRYAEWKRAHPDLAEEYERRSR